MSFIVQGGVQYTLPSGCRTPNPPAMLDGLYPYAFDMTQTDGSKTPTDHALFADMANLREKLMQLQAEGSKLQGKVNEDKLAASPLYVQPITTPFSYAQVEEPPMFASMFESGVIQLPPGLVHEVQVPPAQGDAGLPPPPAPHAVPRPQKESKTPAAAPTGSSGRIVSIGSVGHPFTCAEACKYVKRKGGCRDGSQCTKCHECFWSRVPAGGEKEEEPKPVESVETVPVETQPFSCGSVGHPYTCAKACKYVWRKRGCRDGANCPNCHYCKWQRKPKDEEEEEEEKEESTQTSKTSQSSVALFEGIPPPPGLELPSALPDTELQAPGLLSSVGSLGHPYSCAQACKYVGKAKGCKDGTSCPNCHLCRWSRNAGVTKVIHL
mmetsp:Transcript_67154/g.160175  ORF Transcript_67154/g.160175 Transcript_67154/m.160175 type:complete len:380 (-) Transcript_67154:133-1272(-)